MRRFDNQLLLSSGDLTTFLGCRHASALDHRALDEDLETTAPDATLQFLQNKGIEHEKAYLARLESQGRQVTVISDGATLPDRVQITLEAMRRGDDVIYQAALHHGSWHGFADFLERSEVPSGLGKWSYDVADTKLSTSMSVKYAVQLSIYCELIGAVQGRTPERMSIALGNGKVETLHPNVPIPTKSPRHSEMMAPMDSDMMSPRARASLAANFVALTVGLTSIFFGGL